jgi:hypothetical protein
MKPFMPVIIFLLAVGVIVSALFSVGYLAGRPCISIHCDTIMEPTDTTGEGTLVDMPTQSCSCAEYGPSR